MPNPDAEHLLHSLTNAIGDGRRPTQLMHFITPYPLQPTNLTRDGVLRRHMVKVVVRPHARA